MSDWRAEWTDWTRHKALVIADPEEASSPVISPPTNCNATLDDHLDAWTHLSRQARPSYLVTLTIQKNWTATRPTKSHYSQKITTRSISNVPYSSFLWYSDLHDVSRNNVQYFTTCFSHFDTGVEANLVLTSFILLKWREFIHHFPNISLQSAWDSLVPEIGDVVVFLQL